MADSGSPDGTREPGAPRLSRRALLIGGIAIGAVAAGVVTVVAVNAGGGGSPVETPTPTPTPVPTNTPAEGLPEGFDGGSFVSEARQGASSEWGVYYPKGHEVGSALPVLVVLHGYSDGPREAFQRIHLDQALDGVVAAGGTPFAVAAVQGGDDFWHARESGVDSGAMVVDEFLPLLAERGLLTDRIAFLGWSMGGYGSLLLASKLGPERVASVVAESPALFPRYVEEAKIAFDSAEDYAENGVYGHQDELAGIPVRVDCGTEDDFLPIARAYVAGFETPPEGGFQDGGHTFEYWARMAPAQLAFVASHF